MLSESITEIRYDGRTVLIAADFSETEGALSVTERFADGSLLLRLFTMFERDGRGWREIPKVEAR